MKTNAQVVVIGGGARAAKGEAVALIAAFAFEDVCGGVISWVERSSRQALGLEAVAARKRGDPELEIRAEKVLTAANRAPDENVDKLVRNALDDLACLNSDDEISPRCRSANK